MNKIAECFLLGIFVLGLVSNVTASELSAVEAGGTPAPLNQSERISRLGPHSMYNQVYFSNRIVVGTVKELRPSSEFTDVLISVDEWLKNPLPKEEIIVRIERETNVTMGTVNFSVGEKALLMLKDEDEAKGRFKMLYIDLGKHPVSDRDEVIAILGKSTSPLATTPPIKSDIPHPNPTAQASPKVPGFEMIFGIIGVLLVWRILKRP